MTKIETIIAEIERLKEIGCPLQKGSDYQHGYDEFYTQIKTFINAIPAEQPSERLGDEIDHFRCSDIFALAKRAGEEVTVTAQHFAQWQKEQMIKDAIPAEVVETAEENFIQTLVGIECCPNERFHIGEKVKIIIIKEDEQ